MRLGFLSAIALVFQCVGWLSGKWFLNFQKNWRSKRWRLDDTLIDFESLNSSQHKDNYSIRLYCSRDWEFPSAPSQSRNWIEFSDEWCDTIDDSRVMSSTYKYSIPSCFDCIDMLLINPFSNCFATRLTDKSFWIITKFLWHKLSLDLIIFCFRFRLEIHSNNLQTLHISRSLWDSLFSLTRSFSYPFWNLIDGCHDFSLFSYIFALFESQFSQNF